jgi:hypothetical protein
MGTPSRTAIRAVALSSVLRVRIVDGLQGSRLLPLASRLRRVSPLMWASMSRLRPSGNFSHSGSSVVLMPAPGAGLDSADAPVYCYDHS